MIYLSRGVTRDLADAFPDNEFARSLLANGISIVACRRITAITLDIVCQSSGSYIVDRAADAVGRARGGNACLQVRMGYPPGHHHWSPLALSPYRGPSCHD